MCLSGRRGFRRTRTVRPVRSDHHGRAFGRREVHPRAVASDGSPRSAYRLRVQEGSAGPVDSIHVPHVHLSRREFLQHEVRFAVSVHVLNRNDLPVLFDEKTPFEIGRPLVVKEGSDVALVATGTMTSIALDAAALLEQQGISARVVHLGTIKPLCGKSLREALGSVRGIVSCEEHTLYGGLGSAVAEALSEAPLPMKMVGIQDRYGQSAVCYEELLECYGLTKEAVAKAAEALLGK